MQRDESRSIAARFAQLRATKFGAFVPVLFALTAIWLYFGLTETGVFQSAQFLLSIYAIGSGWHAGCRHYDCVVAR